MVDASRRYLLVDFMNMAFRAHYAYAAQASFTNDQGVPTGMTYGLLSMTFALIRDTKSTHVAFATESKTPTLNARLVEAQAKTSTSVASTFPSGYKGNRKSADPLLIDQLALAEEACLAMGWPVYRSNGYEADDTLASMARQLTEHGHKVVIVTGDIDLWQCVSDLCTVWSPKQGGVYQEVTPASLSIHTKGLRAEQIVEYKALVGDVSDGYPGCPGIGPVGALKLLQEYGSVASIYENISKITGATQRKLIENKELVDLSWSLALLNIDVQTALDSEKGEVQMPYPESAATFIRKHGMASLERRIGHVSFPDETHDLVPLF